MSTFKTDLYNNLPYIAAANTRFEKQLEAANVSRSQFFLELGRFFSEDQDADRYAVCLIHRHYSLKDNELMVTTDSSTEPPTVSSTSPSTDRSRKIIAELWTSNGDELEHRFTDNLTSHPPAPPPNFLKSFQCFLHRYNIDTLGIGYAPVNLPDGYLLLERPKPDGDREQVTTRVHRSSTELEHTIEAAWNLRVKSEVGVRARMMRSCCNCTHGCAILVDKIAQRSTSK